MGVQGVQPAKGVGAGPGVGDHPFQGFQPPPPNKAVSKVEVDVVIVGFVVYAQE